MSNTQYGVSKAAVDKMSEYMAHELKKFNVAVVSLYPGLVRTESVLKSAKHFDISNSESPQFIGRVVAACRSAVRRGCHGNRSKHHEEERQGTGRRTGGAGIRHPGHRRQTATAVNSQRFLSQGDCHWQLVTVALYKVAIMLKNLSVIARS